ncbi:DNA-binding protein [Salmonella enterica]|nr:DNA-binding protein [Salmonella enterica]EKY5297917.1 DNA-binding protein [Salmonella enterica]
MAISKTNVVDACNKLYAEGKNVTLDAVRAITGGSFSTISPLVKEWKAEQSGVNASLESGIARTDVPEKLTELLNTLWMAALATASQKMEAERQLLNDYKVELENERHDLIYASDRIACELDDLKFDFSMLSTNHKNLQDSYNNLERENISLRAELAARDKSITHNESVLGEITRFLKALNNTVPAAPAPAPAADTEAGNKGAAATAETSGDTVNSETVIKNEETPKASPAKPAIKSDSKSKNKAAAKKNAAAGNAPGAAVPVCGKTLNGAGIHSANSVV